MLTYSNYSAKLRLFVLICVDGDGTDENESKNCEEHKREGAEEGSTLFRRRATSRRRDHGERRGESMYMLDVLAFWGFISGAPGGR